MNYIYDGSHLKTNDIDEEQVFSYSNGISLWIVFNNIENTHKCLVKHGDTVISEFKRVNEGEAFANGMLFQAEKEGEYVVKIDDLLSSENNLEMKKEIIRLQKELLKINAEKEKAQALASKLVKGIMKDKAVHTEKKVREILEKHVQDL